MPRVQTPVAPPTEVREGGELADALYNKVRAYAAGSRATSGNRLSSRSATIRCSSSCQGAVRTEGG